MNRQKLDIRTYRSADESAVIDLWRRCGLIVAWNDPALDIARKCADSPELFFVAEKDGELIASCMAGFDGHRGWIYYLAVDPARQRSKIATELVHQAEFALVQQGCPKVELMVRDSNHSVKSFYQDIGYRIEPVSVLSKRLIVDAEHDHGDT